MTTVTDQTGKQLKLRGKFNNRVSLQRNMIAYNKNELVKSKSAYFGKSKRKLKSALESERPVSIHLGYGGLCGGDILALTIGQVNRITKAHQNRKGW